MSELSKLRMELKADFELLTIRTDSMARSFDAHAQKVADLAKETERLGREVAEGQRWMTGRLRQMSERFDAVLGVVENERDLLYELRDRVERLEQDRPPAA